MCEHENVTLISSTPSKDKASYLCQDCFNYIYKSIDYVLSCSNKDFLECRNNGFTKKQARFLVYKYYKDRGFDLDITLL